MSSSLVTVKAEIKAWERAFRAKHDRNPAREDIKARRDIADKYTLYKKLVKAAGEGGTGTPAIATTNNGKGVTKKPKPAIGAEKQGRSEETNPADETNGSSLQPDDLLQTPRKNKTSDRWRRPPAEDVGITDSNPLLLGLPEGMAVDNPFLSPARTHRPTPSQTSLGRNKAYPTPISDPAHRNPFESDVLISGNNQPDLSRKRSEESTAVDQSPSKQAFLFAPSPKRLKSLLQVNSLHASSSSASPRKTSSSTTIPAITPRTRARKRLRGEEVDDTPEKEREREGKSLKIGSRWAQARSLRMQRSSGAVQEEAIAQSVTAGSNANDLQNVGRINVWKRDVQDEAMPHVDDTTAQGKGLSDDDDDDEIFGPTPVKATANGSFSGTATGKRLFLDILPPLEDPVSFPPSAPVLAQNIPKPSVVEQQVHQDLDMTDLDAEDAVGRTPSKAMSRFLASKPRSLASPQNQNHDSVMDLHIDSVAQESPSAMLGDTVEEGAGAIGAAPDENDDGYDEDDEDMIRPEAIDIDAFGDGLEEEQTPDGTDASQNALVREISLSDEEDEDINDIDVDAEMNGIGGSSTARATGRKLRIESYRYTLQQKVAQQRSEKKSSLFSDEEVEEMNEVDYDNKDTADSAPYRGLGFATNQPEPFQALSKLSIQSPESKVVLKTMALQQARAKAIFDGRARAQLRASKRAPVYGAGEGMGNVRAEDEDAGAPGMGRQEMMVDPFVDEGDDDDWESEAEGWKATGLPDDDDW
ncbi:hypothetical protein QFC21_006734 [Naganishia friedmannii]|uniref:Uncharacterized protein n=1 Tax=Naganishia friedmannii TaxID=89922 RepID=A0ACC2V0Y9_9TREE|nr:hypothetical protein QFC21_006734 [Naganishia friedmannii]